MDDTEDQLDGANVRYVVPGDRLFAISEHLTAGIGTYELHGHIYASLAGILYLHSKLEKDKEVKIVEVRRRCERIQKHVMPYVGSIVTAKVQNIGPRFAKCSIHCVDCSALSHEFVGVLRKEDILSAENDKMELHKCVHPGDVILARVIGFGDSQTSYLLCTVEEELGVISGVGDLGERMVPCSQTELRSTLTDVRESRKVARIPDLNKHFFD